MKFTKEQIQEAIKDLRSIVKSGDTVYHFVSHVSSSGMFRCISFMVIKKNKPICLDWYIERICDYNRNEKHTGVSVSGCGMDMGFSVVYNLASAIFKDKGCDNGYKLNSAHL